jgi:ferric-dicitrate binding protein FerR (iron transport regulator)
VRFGAASRTVELDGQGYFEVASSRGVPFLVRSGTMTTQVLGTSFLVRHYANDAQVHVAVAEGKVGITSERTDRWLTSSPVTLTAGHVGDITDSTVHVSTVDDLTPETDWLRGRLVFRHVSVGNVLQTLNRWYGYQFRCSDSTLIQQQVTLSLNARSSAAALSTLEQFLSVRLTVVGDTITLTPYVNRATTGVSRKRAYDVWIPTREAGR